MTIGTNNYTENSTATAQTEKIPMPHALFLGLMYTASGSFLRGDPDTAAISSKVHGYMDKYRDDVTELYKLDPVLVRAAFHKVLEDCDTDPNDTDWAAVQRRREKEAGERALAKFEAITGHKFVEVVYDYGPDNRGQKAYSCDVPGMPAHVPYEDLRDALSKALGTRVPELSELRFDHGGPKGCAYFIAA